MVHSICMMLSTGMQTIKNVSLVYFCSYILDTYNDGFTQTMLSGIGGIPMGIGIFAVWLLVRKFGKRNVTLAGFLLYALGSAVCWAFPTNMTVMLIGQFIKNTGGCPARMCLWRCSRMRWFTWCGKPASAATASPCRCATSSQ